MEVLVNETETGAAHRAVELLESVGHRVHRCHRPGTSGFPCVAVEGSAPCPLDEPGIDVALTMRAHPRSRPTPLEDGVACALRARVPVVVAGRVAFNPYEELGAEAVDGEHVVGHCERVVAAPSPAHTEVATRALLTALHCEAGEAIAVVQRGRDGLRVEIEAAPPIASPAIKAAIPRIIGALREFDRHARAIDVSIVPAN